MQMPSVDLDELGGQLEAMQHHQSEQVCSEPGGSFGTLYTSVWWLKGSDCNSTTLSGIVVEVLQAKVMLPCRLCRQDVGCTATQLVAAHSVL